MTLSIGKVQMDVAELQGTKERLETIATRCCCSKRRLNLRSGELRE